MQTNLQISSSRVGVLLIVDNSSCGLAAWIYVVISVCALILIVLIILIIAFKNKKLGRKLFPNRNVEKGDDKKTADSVAEDSNDVECI